MYVGRHAIELGFKYLLLKQTGEIIKSHNLEELASETYYAYSITEEYMDDEMWLKVRSEVKRAVWEFNIWEKYNHQQMLFKLKSEIYYGMLYKTCTDIDIITLNVLTAFILAVSYILAVENRDNNWELHDSRKTMDFENISF